VAQQPVATVDAMSGELTIVPANEASWEDLQAVVGPANCHGDRCYCQRFKILESDWRAVTDEERAQLLREQTDCGHPRSDTTSGLVAYQDGEPVGWCAVEPRLAYRKLLGSRILWSGRNEDRSDPTVWVAACFVIRAGFRRQGLTYALARAAVEFARRRGARALEGYSMITHPEKTITWGELHVGSRKVFAAAGLTEVSHPTLRRAVMRIDF
jgi:GNAT superfamily N-acetyltransferase